ncbi:hypothetical protein [Aliikangiella maris]|uniref:Uncharacterized protein n=2 Tax=Aliikangiella maris TaxID=3162458 RepID=A0ABV3MSV6_9GAMM
MDKYRIDKFPVSFYLNQFRAEDIEVLPYREAGYYLIEKGELKKVENSSKGKAYITAFFSVMNMLLDEFIGLLSKLALKCHKVFKKEVM